MRHIKRAKLDKRTKSYLEKRQAGVNKGISVKSAWESARKTKAVKNIRNELEKMAGLRSRCFYCDDSRATDIEHFWPKDEYAMYAFEWDNIDDHFRLTDGKLENLHTGQMPACIHVPWESRYRAVFLNLHNMIYGEKHESLR